MAVADPEMRCRLARNSSMTDPAPGGHAAESSPIPQTPAPRPISRWLRRVRRTVYAASPLVLILGAVWLWYFWGWYNEQQVLRQLSGTAWLPNPPLPWLRAHAGPPGFVLDRVAGITVDAGSTPRDLTLLAQLKNLKTIRLTGSGITDLRPLQELHNLDGLAVENTGVVDLSPLAGLSELHWLDLQGTRVTELAPLSGLLKLNFLGIKGTLVKDLHPLQRLKSLHEVECSQETVSEEQAQQWRQILPGTLIERE